MVDTASVKSIHRTFDYREFLDEVYARLCVEDVYTDSSHQFKASGDRYRGGCPFHSSKSGTSFVVERKSLLFWCEGCHHGGSAIDYLHSLKVGHWAKPRGRDFTEVVAYIAKLAEMSLPDRWQNPEEVEKAWKWEARRTILQAVIDYGQEVLWSSRGIDAKKYLIEERKLSEDGIRNLGLGLYLSRLEIQQVLTSKGYDLQECKEAGVLWSQLEGYILFPWFDSYGKPLTIYGRYQTKVPPQGKSKTIALKGEGTKRSPLYLDRVLKAEHKSLILVEGVIDAALLQSKGDTRVCAYVAGSCSQQQIETMKRHRVESVVLCGDPDVGGENGTNSNLVRLMNAGISVSVAPVLPNGLDPDEFLNREGMEGWKAHIEAAEHGFRWKAKQIIQSHSKGNLTDSDRQKILKDAIAFASSQSHYKYELETFFWPVIGQAVGMDAPTWIRDLEQQIHQSTNSQFSESDSHFDNDNGGNGKDSDGDDSNMSNDANLVQNTTLEAKLFYSLFEAGQGQWVTIDDAFYRYTNKGYWQHINDSAVNKLITHRAMKAYELREKNGVVRRVFPFATDNKVTSTFKFNRKALNVGVEYNRHLLCFSNFTVDLRTGEAIAHDRSHFLTTAIAAEYYPNRPCPEVFHQFIYDAYGEEMLDLVRACISMLLDPTAPYGKFIHLIGPSGSGKGTLLRFLSEIFGLDHVRSSTSFEDLATPEGRHQQLTGISMFTLPDVGGYITGLKAFYELVDNGPMSGRALFNSHAYQKRWDVRFVIASVDHLQIENSGDGWDRRCIPLPTKPREGSEDPYLGSKLAQVKSDVISWALAMPREERDRLILTAGSTNERIQNLKRDAAVYGDSVNSFVDLCLRPCEESQQVENHQLHNWYITYCQVHGYAPLAMSKFISHLKTVLPKQRVERHWVNDNGERKMMPASWKQITPVVGAFVDISNLATESNNCHTPQNTSDLTWKCIKSKCVEGGLAAFAEFNPVHRPINNGSQCTGLNSVLHSEVLTSKPGLGADVQGVQVAEIYGETPKATDEEHVQGVQAVQGKELILETKTTPLVNQNCSGLSGKNLEVCPVQSVQ